MNVARPDRRLLFDGALSDPVLIVVAKGKESRRHFVKRGDGWFVARLAPDTGPVRFYLRGQRTSKTIWPPYEKTFEFPRGASTAWVHRATLLDVAPETLKGCRIDSHTHPFNRTSSGGFVFDAKPLVTLLPRVGITHAITSTLGPLKMQEARLVALRRDHPWILPIAWVNPHTDTPSGVESLLKKGFIGFKFHPTVDKYLADSGVLDPYFAIAKRHSVPVQIHSAVDDPSTTDRIVRLARKHSAVPIVMIHTNLGAPDKSETIALSKPFPNIYAETSWMCASSILQIMRALGSQRTIMGTDATVDAYEQFTKRGVTNTKGKPTFTIPEVLRNVRDAASPEDYENWIRLNAIRLYRLRLGRI